MAGLLAWAADVVGGSEGSDDEGGQPAVVFTPEQQQRARELEAKAASLRRSIEDLRLRIPPAHVAQRLPHLHAHSVASNAALALQLNAHSTTREQAQQREITLQNENTAYEKALLTCQMKIKDKLSEADKFRSKLEEMDLIETRLKEELEKARAGASSVNHNQSEISSDYWKSTKGFLTEPKASKAIKIKDLEEKKQQLSSLEEFVQNLASEWLSIQQETMKQPSPAQREKMLERQLHGLVEQLMAKQAQAEGLIGEIHAKEQELERMGSMWRWPETGSLDTNAARSRFGRSASAAVDYSLDAQRPGVSLRGVRFENQQQKLAVLRLGLVLYILTLHLIVFIKITF